MDFRQTLTAKIISALVLAFFLWTFGGGYEIAFAAQNAGQKAEERSQNPKEKRPEKEFQETLEDIEEVIKGIKAEDKTKVKNDKEKLKAKKATIDELDKKLQNQFTETEKKLKDAKLPDEILQRHYNFVGHYEKKLSQLKANLDALERAETEGEINAEVDKAKEFLKKVKPKKKHIPLDPNKLPHRTAEPTKKKPRLKKEEFQNDTNKLSAFSNPQTEPILVASNGSLEGLLDSPLPEPQSQDPLLLALADPPTDADLAETIEVQSTPAIQAKAAELEHNPVKIFNYVRNNFEYEPYYGSLKGGAQTLLERAGNDFDQASLLIALLRVSNIPARYVNGTIQMPIEKFMNWVGGVTDPNTAADILATAGVPGQLLTEGGQIKYAQFEHVWVEAYVPYGNYRGSLRDDTIKTWIPLDPSFKQYQHSRGMDLYQAMAINGEQYIMDYITDTAPSPIPAELNDLFPDYTISPYQYYSQRFFEYIEAINPDATIEEIIGSSTIEGSKAIITKDHPFLLGGLPYNVVTKGTTYAVIPDTLRHKISFAVKNDDAFGLDISYTTLLPEIAGKRVTLSYIPASSSDEALVAQYGGLLLVPPYLLNVKPVIKVNGITVATGNSIGLGYQQIFSMSFNMANLSNDTVTNIVIAGDYSAIAVQYYKTSIDVVGKRMQTLHNNKESTDIDDLLGQMLYNIGISYFHHLNFEEEFYAKNFQMIVTKEPSEVIVTSEAETEWLFNLPSRVTEGKIGIDADRNIYQSFPIDGSQQRKKDFMIVSGLGGSSWEDMIIQSFFNVPSVSAARLLKMAHQQGIPIYIIDSGNVDTVLPVLQVDPDIVSKIRNAINSGKKIYISQTNLQYNDWYGLGYIVLDPIKADAAYLISGGMAGGSTSQNLPDSPREINGMYERLIFSNMRIQILIAAGRLLGTPYVFGCKGPGTKKNNEPCKGIDCSGLVSYAYSQSGIYSMGTPQSPLNAQGQNDASIDTSYPVYADLAFFRGTYDKDDDCDIDQDEGITHVGIYLMSNLMLAAQGTMVDIYSFSTTEVKEEEIVTKVLSCDPDYGYLFYYFNECPGFYRCYEWSKTGNTYNKFEKFGYAPELAPAG